MSDVARNTSLNGTRYGRYFAVRLSSKTASASLACFSTSFSSIQRLRTMLVVEDRLEFVLDGADEGRAIDAVANAAHEKPDRPRTLKAGLLQRLADRALLRRLTRLDAASGQRPFASVDTAHEQDAPIRRHQHDRPDRVGHQHYPNGLSGAWIPGG
jgi:hypothetical protein